MNSFQKQLNVNGLLHNFSFHAVLSSIQYKYFVQGAVVGRERVAFEMKQVGKDRWRVIPPAPLWAFEIEAQLSEVILQQHNE